MAICLYYDKNLFHFLTWSIVFYLLGANNAKKLTGYTAIIGLLIMRLRRDILGESAVAV